MLRRCRESTVAHDLGLELRRSMVQQAALERDAKSGYRFSRKFRIVN